jgi:hypothetical protein
MYFCDVLCIVCFVSFSVLFICTSICLLYYCHRVATQLQLNISYRIINFIPSYVVSCLSCSLAVQVPYAYNKLGDVKVLYSFSLVCFWS